MLLTSFYVLPPGWLTVGLVQHYITGLTKRREFQRTVTSLITYHTDNTQIMASDDRREIRQMMNDMQQKIDHFEGMVKDFLDDEPVENTNRNRTTQHVAMGQVNNQHDPLPPQSEHLFYNIIDTWIT